MARRRKQVSLAGPGYEGTRRIVDDMADDPYGGDLPIRVNRNARHDPVEQLYHQTRNGKRLIGEAERAAGHEIRRLVEAAGLDAVRAILYEAIRVDGGRRGADITDYRLEAADRLRWLRMRLGDETFGLVVSVAGYGETISTAAIRFEDDVAARANGACARGTREHVGWLFRRALKNAADALYGRAEGPDQGRIRAERAVRMRQG